MSVTIFCICIMTVLSLTLITILTNINSFVMNISITSVKKTTIGILYFCGLELLFAGAALSACWIIWDTVLHCWPKSQHVQVYDVTIVGISCWKLRAKIKETVRRRKLLGKL
jgi:hypothetical protein